MATVTGTTIKVNAALAATTSGTTSVTLYTVPANSYVLFNYNIVSGSTAGINYSLQLGGVFAHVANGVAANAQVNVTGLVAGPGQAIVAGSSSVLSGTVSITGTVFTNSP